MRMNPPLEAAQCFEFTPKRYSGLKVLELLEIDTFRRAKKELHDKMCLQKANPRLHVPTSRPSYPGRRAFHLVRLLGGRSAVTAF
jgi:hypothetical protein